MSEKFIEYFNDFVDHVDFSKPSLLISMASVAFNPIFWNIAARLEYNKKVLTKLAGGNSLYGCYTLAVTIFSLGILRDLLYEKALREQPSWEVFTKNQEIIKPLAVALFAAGNVLVLSSMYALGITGTYLGDYFGILMDDIVTGFPFNICANPMYIGSTLSFLATALWFGKPAGVVVTGFVYLMYWIALQFEEPFTAEIYAKRERERAAKLSKD